MRIHISLSFLKQQCTDSHTNRYVLSAEYHEMVDQEQRIAKRYFVNEIQNVLLSLQNGPLKIGELEVLLSLSLNRNQIKYLLTKLTEDKILETTGSARGTKYLISDRFAELHGELLYKNK